MFIARTFSKKASKICCNSKMKIGNWRSVQFKMWIAVLSCSVIFQMDVNVILKVIVLHCIQQAQEVAYTACMKHIMEVHGTYNSFQEVLAFFILTCIHANPEVNLTVLYGSSNFCSEGILRFFSSLHSLCLILISLAFPNVFFRKYSKFTS